MAERAQAPTAVLLAAGLGRRFGGLKQLAVVGPGREAIVDHALTSAAAAGFGQAIVVVRRAILDEVRSHFGRGAPPLPLQFVCQDDLGPHRERPWGTAHALCALAGVVAAPFAVANADDHYGATAWRLLGDWLRDRCSAQRAALVGYRASETLSRNGPVSRAVCDIAPDGALREVVEHTALERDEGGLRSEHGAVPGDPLVSMNLWGFHPAFVAEVEAAWRAFHAEQHTSDHAELRIPDVVDDLIARGALAVDVLGPAHGWIGVTYPEDLEVARAAFATGAP